MIASWPSKPFPAEKVADPDRKQRFVQEAKAASSLNHPNIIVVHDIASDRGLDFIVMEYVEGKTLDQLIGRKGLKLNEALGYAVQIADGLAKAHAAGIVHRDLKPTNIMVTEEDRVKILDFGLAKLTEDVQAGDFGPTMTLGRPEKPQTEGWFILGTVAYMSPEQAEGKKVDSRSDVFSFGSVLYEMLTGNKAFHREGRIATLAAILREEPKPAIQVNETLPPEIEQVLARCLRKDPQSKKPDGDTQGLYHAHQSRFKLNFPPGNGALAVAKDKLALWMGEATGNIYMATPKEK